MTFETFRHPLRHLPVGFPSLSRLAERVWAIEHAFERARAQAKPEEDTRVRIFFVLAAFGLASVPPFVLNVAGPEMLSVPRLAEQLGDLFRKPVTFRGTEAGEALLPAG